VNVGQRSGKCENSDCLGWWQSNTANDTASEGHVTQLPDLTIAKTHSGNFTQGQRSDIRVTVSNNGTVRRARRGGTDTLRRADGNG